MTKKEVVYNEAVSAAVSNQKLSEGLSMENGRALYHVKDDAGNLIPLIGWQFVLNHAKEFFNRDELIATLKKFNLPTEDFKPISKKNAFIRALRSFDSKEVLVHEINEDENYLSYQMDRKFVDKNVASENQIATFITETIVRWNKKDEVLVCDNGDVFRFITNRMQKYQDNYTKADISPRVNKTIEEGGHVFRLRKQGGVYFVPACDHELLFNVLGALKEIDPGNGHQISEKCDLKGCRQEVTHNVKLELISEAEELENYIKELVQKGDNVTDRLFRNKIDVLTEMLTRAEFVTSLTKNKLEGVSDAVEKAKTILKNYHKNFKETGQSMTDDELLAGLKAKHKAQVPDEIEDLING